MIRSRRFTGELGEWYAAQLYQAQRPPTPTQKGWDLVIPSTGAKIQVKTQSFDASNAWNYLESDPSLFDSLLVIILNDDFSVRDLYNVPSQDLTGMVKTGREGKPYYHWNQLEPWRIAPKTLAGYAAISDLVQLR